MGAKHYSTSAKQCKGIEEVFLDLSKSESHTLAQLRHVNVPSATGIIEKENSMTSQQSSGGPRRKSGITVTDDEPTQTEKAGGGGCCG